MVGEILPLVERASGLRALAPPRLATSDAETLERYLTGRVEEQLPEERAAALTAVYARLGLVPDTLDLRRTLLALYREQVVGYYDPRVDTLFVVSHVPSNQLELVLAHELVHALQDQHVDLDSLVRATEGENDRATALQAAVEGHATLAMLEWQLSRMTGRPADVTALPDLGEQLEAADLTALGEEAGLPALSGAPRVIREALVFPYMGGLSFVQRLWQARDGRPAPFGEELPVSSEQVLHPARFLAGPPDVPSAVEFTEEVPESWREVRSDALGELEVRIFLEEHLQDVGRAAQAAEGWDGDRYRLLRGPSGEAFVWATVWDTRRDAAEFEAAVREAYGKRYRGASVARRIDVVRQESGGRPAVLVLDLPAGSDAGAGWGAARYLVSAR